MEWSLVRRALDGRRHLILADGGLSITTSAFAGNAAHSVLLCLDHADSSRGEIFNVGDDRQLDGYMTAQVVAEELGHEWEILSFPHELARPGYPLLQHHSPSHSLSDTSKIRELLNNIKSGYSVIIIADQRTSEGKKIEFFNCPASVSYTHLTLPTNREV